MAIVYRHIRLDKNEPFYIGIGKELERAYNKKDRNAFWKLITKKTDYEVQILFDDLTWDEACEKEKEFISLYGRKDLGTGILVNLTNGGDGCDYWNGRKRGAFTEEHLIKLSESHKGQESFWKDKNIPDTAKIKISDSLKNYYSSNPKKPHTEDTKNKISTSNKERYIKNPKPPLSEDVKIKISNSLKNKPWSEKRRNSSTIPKNAKSILLYDNNNVLLEEYITITEASKKSGISVSSIIRYCQGKRKPKNGYIWRYK